MNIATPARRGTRLTLQIVEVRSPPGLGWHRKWHPSGRSANEGLPDCGLSSISMCEQIQPLPRAFTSVYIGLQCYKMYIKATLCGLFRIDSCKTEVTFAGKHLGLLVMQLPTASHCGRIAYRNELQGGRQLYMLVSRSNRSPRPSML